MKASEVYQEIVRREKEICQRLDALYRRGARTAEGVRIDLHLSLLDGSLFETVHIGNGWLGGEGVSHIVLATVGGFREHVDNALVVLATVGGFREHVDNALGNLAPGWVANNWDCIVLSKRLKGGDGMTKVLYDGEVIGEIVTNRSLTVWEALEILGIDPEEKEGGERKYLLELFDIAWDDED